MAKNRERPENYAGDMPALLASQIEQGLEECPGAHNFDDYDVGTMFLVGEMRLIAKALRAYRPQPEAVVDGDSRI